MALGNQIFTRKQVDRILAEAAERQARDTHSHEIEAGEGLRYSQIVQVAQEAGIEPKYLQRSAKDLIKEAGGLERATLRRIRNKFGNGFLKLLETSFAFPTTARKNYLNDLTEPWAIAGHVLLNAGTFLDFGFDKKFTEPFIYYFGVYLATNIASGFYEWYRHEKNKLLEAQKWEEMKGEAKK